MAIEKFCTKCGKKFIATGREVICPQCKAQAAEESKRAAVERAKRASWSGESVPVRISGRASTLIREYGAAHDVPFQEALDALLKQTACFKGMQMAWEDIVPYKSRRRDKHATEDAPQDKPQASKQDAQDKPQAVQAAKEVKPQASKPQEVKQAARKATTTSKAAAGKAASKPQTSKQAAGKAGKKA